MSKNENYIWLPYTQMQNHLPQLEVESAFGCEIYLKNKQVLIDGVASWWSLAHGYNHPKMIEGITNQVQKLSHIMLAGFKNEQTYNLAKRLTQKTGLYSCFFSDSGSTAVEVAMKISWQYFINLGQKNRKKFISFKNSYHGDTSGAMSLSDLSGGMHQKFKPLLLENYCIKLPENENDLNEFEEFIKLKKDEVAAVFVEPMVQCAGGMKFCDALVLKKIYEITKNYGILFVADEAAVGFYRLGKKFAVDFAEITPDIMILGKALTGGMMTLAATLVSEEIFSAFLDDSKNMLEKALMHGPTFMGNPLAAAASNASLDLFESQNYQEKVLEIEKILKQKLEKFKKIETVKDVRVFGALGVIETEFNYEKMFLMRKIFIEKGVFLRPFAGLIYIMPPLIINQNELIKIIDAIDEVLNLKDFK